ncbi:hypothetical protein DPMN_031257 [Dreissena polymorpha]|uniref:Uncharacterized protein n=1 Tax=Dreissena polymorpha TaxID=45954 RepID=A0A9D4M0L8_DREPO|nr:hypothetical protein DPMN_031257 [Dreissena polymorpha]
MSKAITHVKYQANRSIRRRAHGVDGTVADGRPDFWITPTDCHGLNRTVADGRSENLHRLGAPYVAVLNLPEPDLPHVRRGVVPSVQTVSPSVDISLQCIRASQRTCFR